ncbi:exosome complex RNA-binding protein Csl4 [Archaeoglobus neptunius]|uniref:exosome complex RNA-binding protein Csl4 n=1 Tax=Archaeoglobus neptunius TaxID=2798580 RepID=UPI0019282DA9|nr:exosome complex RNA-binding protein Csl4 [Archaeoglobus neptunius]
MRVVMPGDRIGSSEEYIKGEGVYEENGELFAAVAGNLVIEDRVASVRSFSPIPEIVKGDVILGRVVDVRNSLALVEVASKRGEKRPLTNKGIGILHISNVDEKYVKNINEAVSYLDIIKARVIGDNLRLSTKENEMGVLKALCGVCRSEMVREGDMLKCPECGRTEKRKISTDYGKGEW